MAEVLPLTEPQLAAAEVYTDEVNRQTECSEPNIWNRIRRGVGRVALGLVLATGIYVAESATEAATGVEASAEAYTANGAEKAWCRWPSRYSLCNRASALASKALGGAEKVAKDTGWSLRDGGADAVRHCYWNALMAKEFGRATASGFAWRHEYDEYYGTKASKMDLHNNLKGRDWANTKDPLKRCVQGVKSGELVRILKP